MAQERVVKREVHEETVDGSTAAGTETTRRVTHQTETVQPAQPAPAAPGVTNVNVTKPAVAVDETGAAVSTSGNVSINTPGGTQVNVNG